MVTWPWCMFGFGLGTGIFLGGMLANVIIGGRR